VSSRSLKAVITLCATLALAQAASADPKERWLVATASDGSLAYNAETVKPDPKTGQVIFQSALYLNTAMKSENGKMYQYVLSEDQLNCTSKTFQPLTRVLLDGTSNVVDQFELDAAAWQPVAQNQMLAFFQDIACNGAALGEAREAANIEAAVTLMKTMAK